MYKLIIICIIVFLSSVIADSLYPLPLEPTEHSYARTVLSKNGEPLRAFADAKGVWRYPVQIEQVSPYYLQALLSYEDRWFYWHPGINPFSMLRALWQNIYYGRVISGGSTLTMQVARLMEPHTRTLQGKLKQSVRALQLEWHWSKADILRYYLNHAPFGGPLEGVQVASYSYLGKSAQYLSRAEAALLAVLPQAPSRLRPDRHPERAQVARNKVLQRMVWLKVWTKEQVNEAQIERVIQQWHRPAVIAPLLARRLKSKVVANKGLITTIDHAMQQRLAAQVKQYINRLPPKTSAAVLVVDNATLAVRTYIGASHFMDASRYGYVDMVQAARSPGSTLKPFLYGLAMDAGLIHSASLLIDVPVSFAAYRPSNFNRSFSGVVSVSEALKKSLNIPAVQVLHHLGVNNFVSQLRNAGLRVYLPAGGKANLSVVLGGMGAKLEGLVSLYTALANKGLSGKLRYLPSDPVLQRRFLSEGAAFIVRDILTRDLKGKSGGNKAFAWKTGTSYGFRDMWSIGVSTRYTVGVWIGRPDGTPLPGHYGGRTAAPLLFSLMRSIQAKQEQQRAATKPDSVRQASICWPLGKQQSMTEIGLCHSKKTAWLLEENTPSTFFDDQLWASNPVSLLVDQTTGKRVDISCVHHATKKVKKALWPLAVEPWIPLGFRRKQQLPAYDAQCDYPSTQGEQPMVITGLQKHTVLKAKGSGLRLPSIKLSTKGGSGDVRYWYINGKEITITSSGKSFPYVFKRAGEYQITVIDRIGSTAMITVDISAL
mgnify:CR=1 FL=1